MKQYLDLVKKVWEEGVVTPNRTGEDARAIFGHQMRFNLGKGFPLVTLKNTSFKNVVIELCWFLRGLTNVKWLQDRGCSIWNSWADNNGNLGPVYGRQWRAWRAVDSLCSDDNPGEVSIDQIQILINTLRYDPYSRRLIVSAWNVGELKNMALAPCHCFYQLNVLPDLYGEKVLDLQVYQRSCDLFLGVPFNIASYALLLKLIAIEVGMKPGTLIWTGGNVHLYENHATQVQTLLSRKIHPLPQVIIKQKKSLDEYELEDFTLVGYRSGEVIRAPVAV